MRPVAVLVDGQTIEASAGVLNLRTGVEATPDALFMIQSITKVWTATLVMQLVDAGLVEVDVPVREYLPGFRTDDERASADVTVRHLLTHSGGFEGDIWAPTTSGDDALQRFVEDLVARAPQHSRPGELFSYCSAGYGVLGRLVEVQRELPYAEALRHYLADPLGIEEIAFSADEALGFRTAIGHARPSPDAAQRPLKAWAVMPPSNPAAGNQLAMSARALVAFAGMHLTDGLAPDGTRLLSETSARAMRQRQIDQPAAIGAARGQGLGWMLSARPGCGRARRGHDRRGRDAAHGARVGRGDRGPDQRRERRSAHQRDRRPPARGPGGDPARCPAGGTRRPGPGGGPPAVRGPLRDPPSCATT